MITIEADAPAATWGVGLFETMLIVKHRIPFLDQHFSRMSGSARALGFPAPPQNEFVRAATEAASVPEDEEAGLRCSWLASGTDLDDTSSWTLVATARPLPATAMGRRRKGRAVLLPPSLRRTLPEHKSTSYLPSIAGLRRALQSEADEGLFTTERGEVLEGTMTNVFAVRPGHLFTPPEGKILPGIVRRWVLETATAEGMQIEYRALMKEDLLEGSFLTSSLTGVAAIRSVDGTSAAEPGEGFDLLVRRFSERVGLAAR